MTIGIGFIGAGQHARHHMREFARLPNARLAAAFDTIPSAATEAAKEFPSLRPAESLGDLLTDPDVQAVIIATPAETHKNLVLAALDAGRDVLLEKPMAHTSEEAR